MNVNEHMQPKILAIYENAFAARTLDRVLLDWYFASGDAGPKEHKHVLHSGIGTEVEQGAIAMNLDDNDYLFLRYRGYAAALGKGVPVERIVREITNKCPPSGYENSPDYLGVGFHYPSKRIQGCFGTLGASLSVAVGTALAIKLNKETSMVAIMVGDGESSRTQFGSALNLASLWCLPILFICENNGGSMFTNVSELSSTSTIAERANGYGMEHNCLSNSDPIGTCYAISKIIQYVKRDRRPYLLEIQQNRPISHSTEFGDVSLLPSKDPLSSLRSYLEETNAAGPHLSAFESSYMHTTKKIFEFVLSEPGPSKEGVLARHREVLR